MKLDKTEKKRSFQEKGLGYHSIASQLASERFSHIKLFSLPINIIPYLQSSMVCPKRILNSVLLLICNFLAIDAGQEESKAYPFPYATGYSADGHTGWYVMPEEHPLSEIQSQRYPPPQASHTSRYAHPRNTLLHKGKVIGFSSRFDCYGLQEQQPESGDPGKWNRDVVFLFIGMANLRFTRPLIFLNHRPFQIYASIHLNGACLAGAGEGYQKTGRKVKGASVYKKGDRYYYRDSTKLSPLSYTSRPL